MIVDKWSVRLIVDETVIGPLSLHLTAALDRAVQGLSIGGGRFGEDEGEPCWVTIELLAASGREARIVAQHLVGLACEAAGLTPQELPVAWVAPLSPGDASSHRFLGQARDMTEQELPELAIVAAQIHLEVQVETLMQRAVADDPSPVAAAAIRNRRTWSPHDRWVRPILEALLRVNMENFDRWHEYLEHVTRRNAVVHGGQEMTAEAARASINIVAALWLWLNARGSHGGGVIDAAPRVAVAHTDVSDQLRLFQGIDAYGAPA